MIGFQNPWALALLPLAALPWLLHLLRRRRFRKVPFPSLMLLDERRNMVWRRYRLEEILLLIIRTLLVLGLVAALARPWVRGWLPGWLSTSEQSVVVILDDSASMGAVCGGTTAMGLAKRKLSQVLQAMGSGSKVAVIGGGQGTPVLAGFGHVKAAARAVEVAEPRPAGTDLVGAVVLADRMLSQTKQPLIIIASDFQKNCFGPLKAYGERTESGAGVVLIDAGLKPAPPNLSWHSIKPYPLRRRLAVEGGWTGPGQARISLFKGGRMMHQVSATADSGKKIAVGMELPPGDSVCLVAGGDGLAADDTFFLAETGKRNRTCLIVAEAESPGQALLAKALESLAGAGYRWIRKARPGISELKQADVVMLTAEQLDQPLIDAVARAVDMSRGLVAVPPAGADTSQYNRLFSGLGSSLRLLALAGAGEQPLRLSPGPQVTEAGLDPRIAEAVQVKGYWKASSGVSAALTVGGQEPALVLEEARGCRLVAWLAGIDPSMSDLAFRSLFPILLHRSMEFAGEWLPAGQYQVGDTLRLRSSLEIQVHSPEGIGLTGINEGGTSRWVLSQPGWYRLSGPFGDRLVAANLPSEESDLEPLAGLPGKPENRSGGESASRTRSEQPAWRVLLLVALLLLAAESGLRIRLAGQKNG